MKIIWELMTQERPTQLSLGKVWKLSLEGKSFAFHLRRKGDESWKPGAQDKDLRITPYGCIKGGSSVMAELKKEISRWRSKITKNTLLKQQIKSNIAFIKNYTTHKTLTGQQEIAEEFADYCTELQSRQAEWVLARFEFGTSDWYTIKASLHQLLWRRSQQWSRGQTRQVQLTPILHEVFNGALTHNIWTDTWCNTIVTVIHKEGKDPLQCEGYRPVTLLNVDLKLLGCILVNRLAKVMPGIIDQTAFITNL